MDMDKVKAWKETAELFLEKDIKVYIKDLAGDIYFGEILLVGDDTITIKCFAPEQRANQNFKLYWTLIDRFDAYRESGK